MKKVQHYVCEICGTEYADRIPCEQCEKSHKTPMKIHSARWLSMKQNGSGYPIAITVEMDDGKEITYKR